MTSRDFVIWLKGFSEACHEFHPTPKQWDRLKEVLNEVEDYDDYGGLDEEIDGWYGARQQFNAPPTYSGSLSVSSPAINLTVTSGSHGIGNINATVWNDKMGTWHYTNYPDGFGYYDNKENKKQQLND